MTPVMAPLIRVLLGPDRKLRMLWRAAIFLWLGNWGVPLVLDPLTGWIAQRLGIEPNLSAAAVALSELENFVVALICTAIFAWYEGKRVDGYGLPVREALEFRTA